MLRKQLAFKFFPNEFTGRKFSGFLFRRVRHKNNECKIHLLTKVSDSHLR
jgi:hypothetical protein